MIDINVQKADDIYILCENMSFISESFYKSHNWIWSVLVYKMEGRVDTNYNVCPWPFFISSPELKGLVSVSDRKLFYVRRRCRCCYCHRRRCKLFTILSSSKKPLGQFQPNLAQRILRWRGFKFVKMKGHALFQEEIIWTYRRYDDEI